MCRDDDDRVGVAEQGIERERAMGPAVGVVEGGDVRVVVDDVGAAGDEQPHKLLPIKPQH